MGKLKDLILDLSKKFSNNELVALAGASSIAEIEIEDTTLDDIKTKMDGLMSIDAAKNNTDLDKFFKDKNYSTIKGELLGNIDTDITSTVKSLLGDDAVEKLKEKEFTGDKIKLFGELAKAALESKEPGDEKIKTINTELNKQIVELNKTNEKKDKDHIKELKKEKLGYTNTLIEKEFDAAFNKYNLGDKYEGDLFRNALKTDIRQKVSKVAKLTLSEDGQVIPRNPEDDGLELFVNGNKKVENLGDLMDPLMKDHIKANNVGPQKPGDYVPVKSVKLSRQAEDRIAAAQNEEM